MTTFDQREDTFEKKFALEQERLFKIHARRNNMLGLWAAEALGKTGSAAEDYAREIVAADVAATGNDDAQKKLIRDLSVKGISADQILKKIDAFQALAELAAKADA